MYKIAYLVKDRIVRIYAFIGETSDITATKDWFTKMELKAGVRLVKQSIFIDDSIYAIKLKLAQAMLTDKSDIPSIEEMYFFGKTEKYINPTALFEKHQINRSINKHEYLTIIRNIRDEDMDYDQTKEEYTQEDIMNVFNESNIRHVNISIGQSSNDTYVINPWYVDKSVDNEIITANNNSSLLLEYPELMENTIYVCLLDDIINKHHPSKMISNYFPSIHLLGFSDILPIKDKNKLREETSQRCEHAVNEFNTINMWNEIFRQRTTDITYNERGIKRVSFTIMPEYAMKVPIDVIFKLIHADKNIPLIKYNFSFKQDNIYRLYVDKRTITGEKIPYLPKAHIFNLMKTIGKTKSVAVYSKLEDYEIVCEFATSGNITIIAEFNTPLPYEDNLNRLNELIQQSMIQINDSIMPFFEQNGYRLPVFTDIHTENVVINDITLQISASVRNIMNIDDYYSCVSSIFNIVVVDGNNVELRFKRVGKYNVLHAQQNFIIENKKRNLTNLNIKRQLMIAFNLTDAVAGARVATVISEMAQEQQLNRRNKLIKIPGFETSLMTDRIGGNVIFTVKGINNLNYLNTVPIYIDSWIRVSQPEYTSQFPQQRVMKICMGAIAEEVVLEVIEPEEPAKEEEVLSESEEEEEEEDELENMFGNKTNVNKIGIRRTSSDEESDTNTKKIGVRKSSSSTSGGGPKAKAKKEATETIHNIDGMSLSHPYFFQQRMEDRAKTLFTSMKGDKFKSYSRMCPSSIRRQPVILTSDELAETREKYPGEYTTPDDVLTYSSNKDNKENPETFHYVCPRYWCLKTNSIISEEDVKAGKCGKILPADATKVIKDHYVYEFSAQEEHIDDKGEYIKHYPGFHKNATGDNKCIPCCYKKFSEKQIERRAQCEGVEENKESGYSLKSESPILPPPVVVEEQYILGPEKFPLGVGRWGKLPISIQQFFKDVGAECKVNKNNKNKSSCLLRHGVEKHELKSFLACIADALYYAEYDSNKEPLVLLDVRTFVKDKLLNAFDLDSFLEYQNGTLYDNFLKIDRHKNKSFDKVADKYKITTFYNNSLESKEKRQLFMNVLDAYEAFCDFLQDDKSYIDYTYLWDIICRPNPKLFVAGLNLIILNIPDTDSTTNVEFVCPTNHYSKEVYESRRRTLILLSRDEIFEPVYEYKDIETKIIVTKTFSEYDRYLSTGMHFVLTQIIKPLVREHCKPSKLKVYKYESPTLLDDLVKTLNTRKYKIHTQIINLRGKIVGILAEDTKKVIGFIPCYPTAISANLKKYNPQQYTYITDDIWTTYERTIGFLNRWYKIKKTAKLVASGKCTPKDDFCKVVDDEVVVGFLTNTNQFIQISDPMPNSALNDNIPQIENNNYLVADNSIANAKKDKTHRARSEYSKKIKLENNFYGAFRGAIRILLNDYSNLPNQKELIKEIYNPHALYSDKLTKVIQLLKELTKDRIRFVDSIDIDENEIASSCLSINDEDKCNSNPACFYGESCGLNIPRQNLLSPDTDNDILYYSKMADEMIRYNRIKTFIFQRKNYLLFETLAYNLREDEIIILQSLITQSYFEHLIPSKQNERLGNAYDTANPIESYAVPPLITIEDIIHPVVETIPTQAMIKQLELKQCFPTSSMEVSYPASVNATFQFAIDIIERNTSTQLTQNQIRDKLAELYSHYSNKYKIQIANILIQQGKKTFGSYIKAGTLEIKHMIYTEGYYLTNLDLWLLLDHYKIESMLLSHKLLLETEYESKYFCFFTTEDPEIFVFILNSAIKIETPPTFRYVELRGESKIRLDDINEVCIDDVYASISERIEIEQYISSFKPIVTTKYVKKQPGLRQHIEIPLALKEESDMSKESKEKEGKEKEPMLIPDLVKQQSIEPAKPVKRQKGTKKVVHRHKKHDKTKKSSS